MKYLAITIIVFSFIYYLTQEFLEFTADIFIFSSNTILLILIGTLAYIAITYITDKRTKNLVSGIINEFKERF
jgi:membrane protein insertase Oxa1/YidC/SpoIIIJ